MSIGMWGIKMINSKIDEMRFDILHSECRDCYLKNLECTYYYDGCRRVE